MKSLADGSAPPFWGLSMAGAGAATGAGRGRGRGPRPTAAPGLGHVWWFFGLGLDKHTL